MPWSALIALGSNLPSPAGPPSRTVAAAMDALAGLGRVAGRSRLWRSPAWPPGGPDYVNAAAVLLTELEPEPLLEGLHGIERTLGRDRAVRWGARTLDLDLLAWEDAVRPDAATQAEWRELEAGRQLREAPSSLILPHPRLQDRAFVLEPLAEVAPGWTHPLLNRTVRQMLADLPPDALEGLEPLGSE